MEQTRGGLQEPQGQTQHQAEHPHMEMEGRKQTIPDKVGYFRPRTKNISCYIYGENKFISMDKVLTM